MPSPLDDQYMHSDNDLLSPIPEQSTSPLLPTIRVIGGIAKLLRMLKSRYLPPTALEAYDSHFKACMQSFPLYQQIRTNQYVDPIELPSIMYLQNALLMLHRHNLMPISSAKERSTALDHCASTAAETARLLRRCMQETPPESRSLVTEQNGSWEKRMVSASSAFLCTHIWRCTLFLIFRSDFENAIWCAQASATLGASRPINIACGRYLQFFLNEVIVKMNQGKQLDMDEEMIAYVSADLQSNFENSWVWRNSKGDVSLNESDYGSASTTEDGRREITRTDAASWDEWEDVFGLLDHLFHQKQREQQHRAIAESSLRPPLTLPPLAPSPNLANPSNRMSIKDLI
ncbi:hypothetical protein ACLMJK_002374 [Lecanora helva]